ncbi:AAA family ATPase [Nostoc sp. FACHB-87]|uniref:trifunctional serine/threonine-protein kinase/ATP-binding protein/sensor histidine kinase n=1 Tax=Nostocaceae TaxID=1162 RepID=UPI001683097C|nr:MULTISPECIES: ATP-binding sensor histidine kinase [Nostocaceae]MBD2454159.1 AAA family ATPase [Nostoc sp. FACHB-87]MBD2476146.1 AAA family ATPase [Anabaena sp. FACHB-83]
MIDTLVKIPGYRISEELYNGSRTLVYRAVRESDSIPVVIKLLKNPYPSFSELLLFRNQYTIGKNLNSPLIIQTYSLEPLHNGYMLVMEDFGGISLKDYFSKNQGLASLEEFLILAIALCDTLNLLYHERIIHKDIKPSNILINPETKQIKLIDFSIASLLPRETQTLVNPNVLEGTLAYISPEQTGRMNRGIDYRTDFYSLGVTFYEFLTGELPFSSNDAMELVHSHIAKIPPLLHAINRDIPSVISEIVSKLMAKNAEDRYQSALGLKFDLEKCLNQLRETGEIQSFAIASRDLCDRFIIPDKLYGRETEVNTLLEAFERVSQGTTEMMLVAGFSGIGKTAVVNEVHKPIVRQRGYFIKGKYDQFQRNIPFSAFVQAFRDLMGQLLTESDVQIQQWKHKIVEAVGENGQVIIEVIPELENIIGKQAPAKKLSGAAAENRFNLLFQKFTQVFTTPEHPLVMFLDDLQWADSASLKLMQLLMADIGYLFIIGAYRDNEVHSGHPLLLTLSEIQKTQATINTINLVPLSQVQVNQLVADTLKCSEALAWNLSVLIYQKTQGNPFFATQFLKALHQDRLIQFDFELGCWECDISQVKAQAVTDDVVAFMSWQLQKLPPSTQEIIKLAACIGNSFDLATLAIVAEQSQIETAACLWKALQEGLIIPIGDVYKFYVGQENLVSISANQQTVNYKFIHDRVQQAAYSLIPDDQKQATHYQVGQLLWKNTDVAAIELKIFDIVNQLNKGIDIIIQASECYELAELNLLAGKKAKTSTAYKSAVKYLEVGIKLLSIDSWQNHYQLTFDLYRDCAECEYFNSNFAQAEKLYDIALQNTPDDIHKAEIYASLSTLRIVQGENLAAGFAAAQEGLRVLGITVPDRTALPTEIQAQLEKVQAKLATIELSSLLEQAKMTATLQKAQMKLLLGMCTAAYLIGNEELGFLSNLLMLDLSLNYGAAESSGFAYCFYGISLVNQGEYQKAYEFGQLASALDRQFEALPFIVKSNNHFCHAINLYSRHIKTNLPIYDESFRICQEIGDLLYGVWSVVFITWTHLIKGDPLNEVYAETEKYHSYVERVNDQNMLYMFSLQREFLLHLQALTEVTDLLDDGLVDRTTPYIEVWRQKQVTYCINWYNQLKIQLLYLYGRYTEAIASAAEIEQTMGAAGNFFPIIQYHFYYPLSLAALYPTVTAETKIQYWGILQQQQQLLKRQSETCSANFLHRYLLLSAEMAHISGNPLEASDYYDRAISLAQENDYLQEEALANELAAKFYLDWGKQRIAQEYMIQAYYCYARWGAKAKVADLEKRYPQLLAPILQQTRAAFSTNETIFTLGTVTSTRSSSSSTSVSDTLDLTAILKASQTISGEIELEKLLASLLSIVIETAGADKCVLMLLQDNHLLIQGAITQGTNPVVLQSLAIEDSQDIPQKLIYKVKNNQQTVVLLDAIADITFANDPYIIRQQPKSILCSPILNQGKLLGILYLENNLAKGAFTSERVELLNLLCAQAAISLENAQLYQRSQEYAQQLEQALQDLQQAQLQMVQTEKMSALGNLVAGVAHEMNNPLGFIAATLKQAKPTFADIIEHLKIYQETLPDKTEEILDHEAEIDLEYTIEDLPKMLDSMTMACDRLKNISTSLRTFSRADRDYKVPFNLHEGIDSTILILKHRLKANEQRPAIEVVTNYANLPQLECFPGQLNQVFMNILANAIDALDESNHGRSFAEIQAHPNQITITTSIADKFVKISIADNGKGMSAEVKHKIFDHLFTTKGVGKGTGLGLAIARQIIEEKHGGKITVNSILGEGTEFIISLPII